MVCKTVCEMKEIKKTVWNVKCEPFCVPLPGHGRSCGCDDAACGGCEANCGATPACSEGRCGKCKDFLLPRTRVLLPQCGARSRRFAGCMRFLAHQGRLMKTAHCPWQRQPIQAAGQDQKDRRQSEKHQRKIAASLIVIGSLVADVHETLTKKASNSTSCYVNDRPDLLGNREEIVRNVSFNPALSPTES